MDPTDQENDSGKGKRLDYQTFADEHGLKDEVLRFTEAEVVFTDKFQNENRRLKAELLEISRVKLALYLLANIAFLCLPLLFSKWNLRFKLWALFVPSGFHTASHIKITDFDSATVELTNLSEREIEIHGNCDNFKFFVYHFTKYFYNRDTRCFQQVEFKIENMTNREVFEKYQNGVSEQVYLERMGFLFDKNIIAIPEKSIIDILIDEILNPFNLFQIFSFAVWYIDDYGAYAIFLAVITLGSIFLSLYEIKQNYKRLKDMLYFQREVQVLRNGSFAPMPSGELVPGDIIQIPENSSIPCDLILIKGSCVVNEAVLTGESIPVPKNPLLENHHPFTTLGSQQNMLFSGSFCIKTGDHEKCLGLVYQIGFHTYKGQIAKELIYMKGKRFSFLEDSFKYMFVLFGFAVIGFLITLYPMIQYGFPTSDIIIRGLELVTITIPPALPAAMETGIEYSIGRLWKLRVSSLHPQKINIVGKINFVAFDKTGTLTEEGLDIFGYQINRGREFAELRREIPAKDRELSLLVMCFATCHNLISLDGKLAGDPLDLKMFEFSKWIYREIGNLREFHPIGDMFSSELSAGLSICRIFEFEPALQRMSVIFREKSKGKLYLSIKGSPEQIFALCDKTTVPSNYHAINKLHAQKGYRVIALGIRELAISDEEIVEISRNTAETQVRFLGFLICENRLKPESTGVIAELTAAQINSVMVTGDNPLTAMSVAKECGIIRPGSKTYLLEKSEKLAESKAKTFRLKRLDENGLENDSDSVDFDQLSAGVFLSRVQTVCAEAEDRATVFAVTGEAFEFVYGLLSDPESQDRTKDFLNRTSVFSRMKPHNKSQLIQYLRSCDHFVLMTGDGANDCVAMKKADIGFSLSQEEASLASDFTSQNAKIEDLIMLIKEGRAALCTSINCFKFMTLYSMIQFLSVSILYLFDSDLTTYQYVYADVLMIIPLAFTMNLSRPADRLSIESPIYKLISLPVLSSVIGQILIVLIMQVAAIGVLMTYSFYTPNYELNSLEDIEDEEASSYENNTLFLVSCCQYLASGLAFCEGEPFRKPFYRNLWFLASLILLAGLQFYINFSPSQFFVDLLDLLDLTLEFKFVIFAISMLSFAVVMVFEKKVVACFVRRCQSNFD